jgi:tetratricopeptide (TPR) repeat protein
MKKNVFKIFVFLLFSSLIFADSKNAVNSRPIVQNIRAVAASSSKINVTWTLPQNPEPKITKILVYRSKIPVTSFDQIKNETPVATLLADTTGWTDNLTDYSDYFYAVIAYTDEPYDLILVSINSTVAGVHINYAQNQNDETVVEEEKKYEDGISRELPLPFLDLSEGKESGQNYFSETTLQKVRELGVSGKKNIKKLDAYYFEEDLISPDSGDDYLLFDILKNHFIQKKYDTAASQLERLISANIADSTKNRAYFYLGESYYLSGKYKDAIKYFVQVEDVYPSLSKKWLDSSLDLIEN